MMGYSEDCGEIGVCVDCMAAHANGEHDPDRPASEPTVWSLVRFGYTVTMGGRHRDDCPNRYAVVSDTDCDCDDMGFCRTQCEGCGSYLAGDRFRFTMWRMTNAEADTAARASMKSARKWRDAGHIRHALIDLDTAAECRRFIADRIAEDKRFAEWKARTGRVCA